ncbi:MAG: hypothetical protein IPK59_16345 [Rhodospirillaceae bacterium]|nr:hypothetical protein [Rhodospirillaceae bacterium]
MNKTQLLSAIAFTTLTITWMPIAAQANAGTCTQLSGQALQQRINAGKCDTATHLSPEMTTALAMAEKGKKAGDTFIEQPVTEDGEEPGDEEAKNDGGEPSKENGSDVDGDSGNGSGNGGGKQKKLPGDEIVMKNPGGKINIGDKPVLKKHKQPNGDEAIGEKIEELEFGTPEHDLAIAEEVEVLGLADPKEPNLGLAAPKEPIKALAEPEDPIKTLAEPKDKLRVLADPKKSEPALFEKIGDLLFGAPNDVKGAFQNGRDGKDAKGNDGGKKDKDSGRGSRGGSGIAG